MFSLISASLQSGNEATFAPVAESEIAMAEVVATVTLPQASKASVKRVTPRTPATAWEAGTQQAWITAYSSTPDQTDDTPFITASGKNVRDGIIATNHLKFGTRVQIPELFGDKVFVVEDRMHPRKQGFVDVWMPTREEAMRFGIAHADIVVLD